jgi:hypothetical protein
MGVQGLFLSLIGVHAHSQVFRKCSTHVQPVQVTEGPMNMFSNLQCAQRPYILALSFAKQEDIMSGVLDW